MVKKLLLLNKKKKKKKKTESKELLQNKLNQGAYNQTIHLKIPTIQRERQRFPITHREMRDEYNAFLNLRGAEGMP